MSSPLSRRRSSRSKIRIPDWLGALVGILLVVIVVYHAGCILLRPLNWSQGEQLPNDLRGTTVDEVKLEAERQKNDLQWLVVRYPTSRNLRDVQAVLKEKAVKLHFGEKNYEPRITKLSEGSAVGNSVTLTSVFLVPRTLPTDVELQFQYGDDRILLRRQWKAYLD